MKKMFIGLVLLFSTTVYAQFSIIEFSTKFKENYKLYGLEKIGFSNNLTVDALVSAENLLNISNDDGTYKVIVEENKVVDGVKSITLLATNNKKRILRMNLLIESEDFSERNYITRIKYINLETSKRMDYSYSSITETVLVVFKEAAKVFYDIEKLK